MKSKKLMLCILIAMIFSFGIGSTDVLADNTPAVQETLNDATAGISEDAKVDEIVKTDSNIEDDEDKDNIKETAKPETAAKTTTTKDTTKATPKATTKKVTTKKVTTKKVTTKKVTAKTTVVKKYTNSELRLLSALIYSEAGNQSYKGKLAVGNVVLNRLKSSAFSHTKSVKGVIYDNKWGIQFSVIKKGSNGTSPISRALKLYDTRTSASGDAKANMLECIKAAKTALNGDNNIGSYLNFNRKSKYLLNKYSNHVIIGDHIFYNTK